jgi:TRAP-type transport system periplasmic protein
MNRISKWGFACLAAAAASWSAASSAQTTLTLSAWHPPTHAVMTHVMVPWAEAVEKETDGRVKVRILPKPVAAPPATFDAVKNGLADISYGVHGYSPGRFVLTKAVELPFIGNSAETISVAYWRVHERSLAEGKEHEGVKLLGLFAHGPGAIHNAKREIKSVADLEGLKFRVAGGVVGDLASRLGIVGILKPAPEAYMLLSNGVADGVLFPMEAIKSFNLEKLVPYTTRVPGGLYNVSFFFVMNEAKFDGLPEKDREAILRLSGENFAVRSGKAWDWADEQGLAAAKEAGNTITTATPRLLEEIRAATVAIEEEWIAAAKAKGIDGALVLDELRAEVAKLEKR